MLEALVRKNSAASAIRSGVPSLAQERGFQRVVVPLAQAGQQPPRQGACQRVERALGTSIGTELPTPTTPAIGEMLTIEPARASDD
jgi:hypothetical protein